MTKYRVSWEVFDENNKLQPRERIFTILHQGWTYYQMLCKGRSKTYKVRWEHIGEDD